MAAEQLGASGFERLRLSGFWGGFFKRAIGFKSSGRFCVFKAFLEFKALEGFNT